MELSVREYELIQKGTIKAVLRWHNIPEQPGDFLFAVNGKPYRLTAKTRWSLFREGAQRSYEDFGCKSVKDFKNRVGYLYGDYAKIAKDLVYVISFKPDVEQDTLI